MKKNINGLADELAKLYGLKPISKPNCDHAIELNNGIVVYLNGNNTIVEPLPNLHNMTNANQLIEIFMEQSLAKVWQLCCNYHFEDEECIIGFVNDVLRYAISVEKYNVCIKGTSDEQIVIWRKHSGCFNNLAIDEDCDVTYMCFAKDDSQSKIKHFYYSDGIDIAYLVSLL